MIWGKEEEEGGEGPWLQRTKSNGREMSCAAFFKDTQNEKKQEAPRGFLGREMKFEMEIYELGMELSSGVLA